MAIEAAHAQVLIQTAKRPSPVLVNERLLDAIYKENRTVRNVQLYGRCNETPYGNRVQTLANCADPL